MLTSSTALRAHFTLALAAFATAAACSSEPSGTGTTGAGGSTSTTGPTTSSGAGASTGTGGAGGSAACPTGPGYGGNETSLALASVDATIVDLNGMPAADTVVQVCGLDICLSGSTNSAGKAAVSGMGKSLKAPAFKYGDGVHYARLAIPLTQATTMFPTLVTAKLPSPGVAFTPGKDITSGEVTLSIPAGGSAIVDDLNFPDPADQTFRAATIEPNKIKEALDPALGIEMVFGAGPMDTLFCPAAKVTVPNSLGWPAGTAVEFYLHGIDISQDWAPYAGWAKVSDGEVSADGKSISTSDGGGLPILSVFGVRKKM